MKRLLLIIVLISCSMALLAQPKYMGKTSPEIKQAFMNKVKTNPKTFELDTIRTTKKGVLIVEYWIKDDIGIPERVKMFYYFNGVGKVYSEVKRTERNTYWESLLILNIKTMKPTPAGHKIFLDRTMNYVSDLYYLSGGISMEIVPDFAPHLDIIYTKLNLE